MGSRKLELVRRLEALTTEQIEAAKRLDGPRLAELGQLRADLNFELKCAMEDAVPVNERLVLIDAARRLKSLEARLAAVAQTVSDALDAALPQKSKVVTYGRTGRVA